MSHVEIPSTDLIAAELAHTLPSLRFFADKAADIEAIEIIDSSPAIRDHATAPDVDMVIVAVRTAAASPTYQLPIAWAHGLPDHETSTPPAMLVNGDGVIGYDALGDADCVTALGQELLKTGSLGAMKLRRVPGTELNVPEHGRPMGVEQSNTSVIFDDAVMCKFFRRLHPGTNADVELLAALSTSNCESVPHLFGWIELEIGDDSNTDTYTTAMLQSFLPNSADGWAMALTSVRDVIRDPLTDIGDLGTDFDTEALQLGQAVAEVHAHLAAALPANRTVSGEELVAPMRERLTHVAQLVPEIAERADAAEKVFVAAAEAVSKDGVVVQRIHGDLHLGQVLRTPRHWLLIDFEGEPSRPWEERRLPDHPLRDIAGMIRSFDYAAHFPLLAGRDDSATARQRVAEWASRNIAEFLRGYSQIDPDAEVSTSAPDSGSLFDERLLNAFILDKAIYECLYEAQNRPDWLELPLAAVQRLLNEDLT
ncbi:maltokinase N-terminal cap-like domain-containing protein [Corynebacterium sp. H113]|uniref:maltokinase N-terminal cap-like domain-containing protein n=1 Tax=Corynebacterium sp. H113 TaxID=3133419 RepID=UPI0030AA229E